jgi:hypothetical protein
MHPFQKEGTRRRKKERERKKEVNKRSGEKC